MGIFNDAQNILDRGVSAAKGVVTNLAIEQQSTAKAFSRLCSDGCAQGWHEANGGNVSYRMKPEEVDVYRLFFYDTPPSWMPLEVSVANLGGEFFMISAAGSFLRNVATDFESNVGIVEIAQSADRWRVVWGFKGGGQPTSEFVSHMLVHSIRKTYFGDKSRVLYHAHPPYVISLTEVLPLDSRTFTRLVWKSMLEGIVALPSGVGVVPWMVPGTAAIADATAQVMRVHDVCVWEYHGLMSAGENFDVAFGRAQVVEKAASIYTRTRVMNRGHTWGLKSIPDESLRTLAKTYNLCVNEDYL